MKTMSLYKCSDNISGKLQGIKVKTNPNNERIHWHNRVKNLMLKRISSLSIYKHEREGIMERKTHLQ